MIKHGQRLDGVHPDLVRVILRAGNKCDFQVQEGLRTPERQRELVAQGKSQTLNSRHLTGHAVDLTVLLRDGSVTWDFHEYRRVADIVLAVAGDFGIPIIWGGNWASLVDGPHYELDRQRYPVTVSA